MKTMKNYEKEIKKGCGQDLPDCLCGENNRLCISCREEIETIQKCKELFKEMFKELIFNINRDLIKGNYMDEDEIIDDLKWKSLVSILEKELLSQLGEEE